MIFGFCKLGRLVLDALRNGERPMSTAEIVAAIVEMLDYGPDAAKGMTQRHDATSAGELALSGEREWGCQEGRRAGKGAVDYRLVSERQCRKITKPRSICGRGYVGCDVMLSVCKHLL